jgi:hypothetical protein
LERVTTALRVAALTLVVAVSRATMDRVVTLVRVDAARVAAPCVGEQRVGVMSSETCARTRVYTR